MVTHYHALFKRRLPPSVRRSVAERGLIPDAPEKGPLRRKNVHTKRPRTSGTKSADGRG